MDREYIAITIKSKFPDKFQMNHIKPIFYDPTRLEEIYLRETKPTEIAAIESSPEDDNREDPVLTDKTIRISDGDTGYSFEGLFYEYLRTAKVIKITDPYIRQDYQIKNLMIFLNMIAPPEGNVEVYLTTSSEDKFNLDEQTESLKNSSMIY